MCIYIIGLRVRDMLTKEVFGTVHDSSLLSKGKLLRSLSGLYFVIVGDYDRVLIGAGLTHGR